MFVSFFFIFYLENRPDYFAVLWDSREKRVALEVFFYPGDV